MRKKREREKVNTGHKFVISAFQYPLGEYFGITKELSRTFQKLLLSDNKVPKTTTGKKRNHFPAILREAINAPYARKLATVAKIAK